MSNICTVITIDKSLTTRRGPATFRMMASQYPIRAVSQLTGLGLDTLRAWERRHGAVKPTRAERGRLYSEEDVRRLRLLRGAVDAGHAIGQIAALADAELERLQRAPQASRDGEPMPVPKRLQGLIESIQAYDSAAVDEELGRLALLLNAADLVYEVVLPLMRLTGERWEHGTFRVAHEHLLSASIRSLLGALIRRRDLRASAGKMVVATPPGEFHEFGILAAALLAVAHHFEVAYLGANLPLKDILDAAQVLRPRAIVTGVMELNVTAELSAGIGLLVRELPAGIELWMGGSGARMTIDPAWSQAVVIEDLKDFERHLDRLRG